MVLNRLDSRVFQQRFDQILGPLSQRFFREADSILDLRGAALNRQHPGRCIQRYFKLYGIADPGSEDLLRPLRVWIESNIEVIAKDGREQILEQLPLRLDAPDLEAYCQDVIHEFRTNRVYPSQNLTLEFRYKEAA
jgi:hypothetical protein